MNLGLGQKQAVWVLYGFCVFAGLVAFVASQASRNLVLAMPCRLPVLAVGAGVFLGRVKTETQ